MITWYKIEDNPPPQLTLLMVTGDSGYVSHEKFLTFAYIDEEYRPSNGGPLRWQSVVCDSLSESGWFPTHWAWPINLPGDDADPAPEPVVPLSKRPVAFRVKDFADDWILFHDEEKALAEAEATGAKMQGLYVRDGSVDVETLPHGFEWINQPVIVKGEDFTYGAMCLCSFPKTSGKVRYIVEDNGRLFVQRREQLTFVTQNVAVQANAPKMYSKGCPHCGHFHPPDGTCV